MPNASKSLFPPCETSKSRSLRKLMRILASAAALIAVSSSAALAEGALNIFNFGNYTSPEMISKFEAQYDVKVTVTDYDSSDAALAKVHAGGHGFDVAIVAANFIPIWINEGLLMEARPDTMSNFKNVEDRWLNPEFDPGRHYSVPWTWGLTGVLVDSSVYKGDINSMSIILDPPPELAGKIGILPDMNDVMFATIRYLGGEQCSADKDLLKKVRDKLLSARANWIGIDFGVVEKMAAKDYAAAYFYNGAAMRARETNPDVRFGFPKDGFPYYMDSAAILKDAQNAENAKLFLNFLMQPEAAAMLSNFTRAPNAIKGSEAFMDKAMLDAPELKVPADFASNGEFLKPCSPEVNDIYTQIWTEVLQ